MPDFIAEWLNQNEIFTAMTLMEYWDGMVTTVHLVFLSLVIGLLVAVPLAILRTVRNPFVSGPVWLYTYLFRGTPLLIQLYIIYYGIAQIPGIQETFWWEIFREPFYPALLAFTLNTAAYTTEIIRGAIVSTPNGEIEAAKAYGFSRWHTFRRVMIPQMLRHALPGIGNNWQVLLKTTALVSIIGLTDMVRVAEEAAKAERMPFHFFVPVAAVYLALTAGSELFIKWLDRRANVGVVQGN